MTKKPFKWWDIVIVLALVLMLILPYVLMRPQEGATVEIYGDGALVARFDLNADRDYLFENRGLSNLVRIQGGKVRVLDATCPDKLCEQMPPISMENEVILCIPSGLKVEIKGVPSDVDGETSWVICA